MLVCTKFLYNVAIVVCLGYQVTLCVFSVHPLGESSRGGILSETSDVYTILYNVFPIFILLLSIRRAVLGALIVRLCNCHPWLCIRIVHCWLT